MAAVGSNTDGNYEVRVCSGRHAGANIALAAGTYVIGAGADADIVLTDDGIVGRHVELRLDDGFCRIWSLDGGARVDTQRLNPGAMTVVELPTEFLAGDIKVMLCPPARVRAKRPPWRGRLLVGLAGVAILGGALVNWGTLPAFGTTMLGASSVSDIGQAAAAVVSGTAAPPAAAPARPKGHEDEVASAAAAMEARLRSIGLAGDVTVHVNGNIIEASGGIQPEQNRAWTGALVWLDSLYKGSIPLVNQVKVEQGAARPQLSIQAIWAGAGPYVIGGDGEKYGQGATLPGGWKIETIATQEVIVSRRGERVSLTP